MIYDKAEVHTINGKILIFESVADITIDNNSIVFWNDEKTGQLVVMKNAIAGYYLIPKP